MTMLCNVKSESLAEMKLFSILSLEVSSLRSKNALERGRLSYFEPFSDCCLLPESYNKTL